MPLERLAVDDSPHNRDGLVLHGYDGSSEVTAFISRLVIDDWIDPTQGDQKRRSLCRQEYNTLGKLNLAKSNGLSRSNTSVVRRSIASIRSWTCCFRISGKWRTAGPWGFCARDSRRLLTTAWAETALACANHTSTAASVCNQFIGTPRLHR